MKKLTIALMMCFMMVMVGCGDDGDDNAIKVLTDEDGEMVVSLLRNMGCNSLGETEDTESVWFYIPEDMGEYIEHDDGIELTRDGSCGGEVSVRWAFDESEQESTITVLSTEFCDEVTIEDVDYTVTHNGKLTISMNQLDANGQQIHFVTPAKGFDIVIEEDGTEITNCNVVLDCTVQAIENPEDNTANIQMWIDQFVMIDHLASNTTTIEDGTIQISIYGGNEEPEKSETTLSGKITDNDGTITISTPDPIMSEEDLTVSGHILIEGANSTSIMIECIGNNDFAVNMDLDGDEIYETIETLNCDITVDLPGFTEEEN